jgi:hypothetical protein
MAFNTLKKSFKSLGNLRSHYNDNDNQQILSNHTPPSDIPSNIPSSIPRNILAFRTITMMLAKLQPKQTSESSPGRDRDASSTDYEVSPQTRREVRISDAFAHLAIVNNEVIALVTEYSSDKMAIVACASTPENPPEKQPNPESYVGQCLKFLFSKNPRRDDPPTDPVVTYPKIISTTQPEDMGSQTLRDYIQNLDGSS